MNVIPIMHMQVKRKLASTYEKFESKKLQLPEQLRQRAKVRRRFCSTTSMQLQAQAVQARCLPEDMLMCALALPSLF
jgi:hypothetical protein